MAKRLSQFDIRKIPKEILERNHVSYSPYRLNASCNSRLQTDKDGQFICTPIEGNLNDAIADITSTFPIDKEYQVIKTSDPNGQFVSLLIAAVGGNFEIIHKSMAQYNLFPSINPIGIIVPDGEHDWLDVSFYPAGYNITNSGAEGGLKPLFAMDLSQIDIDILRPYYTSKEILDFTIPMEILDRGWQRYHPYSFTIDHRNPLANRSIEEATDCKRQIQLVKQAITKTFPIDESQFEIKDGNDGLYATVLVANTDDNVDIIEQAMEDKGFYRSQPTTDKLLYDSKHREWLDIKFEPKVPDDVTAEVHRKYSVLFYLTPKIFEDRIQKHGLLVSNNNPNYRKSGLQAILSDGIISQADKQQLVNSLYAQAQNKSIPNLTPEYSLFAFDIRRMGYDIRFYYDVNEPKGLYTRTLIPPGFIINIEHIIADSNN